MSINPDVALGSSPAAASAASAASQLRFVTKVPGYIRPIFGTEFAPFPENPNARQNNTSIGILPDEIKDLMKAPIDEKTIPFMKYNIHGRMPQNAGVGRAVTHFMRFALGRHQTWPGNNNAGADWPDHSFGGEWYHYTFFPAIRKFGSQTRVLTYVAMYSSFNPWKGTRSIPYNAPRFQQYTTRADTRAPNIGPVTINVDNQYIGSDDTVLAIQAALENTRPMNGSYLCFFPLVTYDQFVAETPYQDEESESYLEGRARAWRLSGSSLGSAVQTLIQGYPSVFFTGYLSAIYPNERIMRSGETAGDSYKVPVQMNFVEQVDQIALKVAYCADSPPLPIVIPNKDSLNRYIDPKKIKGLLSALIDMSPRFITAADIDDGRPIMTGAMATPVAMAATTTDQLVLACYLWLYAQFYTTAYLEDTQTARDIISGVTSQYNAKRWLEQDARTRANKAFNAEWKSRFEADWQKATNEYIADREANFEGKLDEKEAKLEEQIRKRMQSLEKLNAKERTKITEQAARRSAKPQGKKYVAAKKEKKKPPVATRAVAKMQGALRSTGKQKAFTAPTKRDEYLKQMEMYGKGPRGTFTAPNRPIKAVPFNLFRRLTPQQQDQLLRDGAQILPAETMQTATPRTNVPSAQAEVRVGEDGEE